MACDLGGSLTGAAGLGLLFAGNTVGEIIAIDPASGQVVRTVATGEGPFDGGLAYVDGVLLAAAYMAPVAQRIDPETGTVIGQLPLENPTRGHLSGLAADGVGGGRRRAYCRRCPGCVWQPRFRQPLLAAVCCARRSRPGRRIRHGVLFNRRLDASHNSAPSLSLDLTWMGQLPGGRGGLCRKRADRQRRGGRKRDADHHQRASALADGPTRSPQGRRK